MLRSIALSLLAVIAADVVGDADCDPLRLDVGSVTLAVAPAGATSTADPCADFCVPDCFCCARSVGAATAAVPPVPALLSPLAPADAADRTQGVRPLLDHPPRPLPRTS
jgi:hypothetical protein